ncbi:MAG: sigma-54-dependent transcriptional regulator [Polyangiales bacterium]
MATVLVTDDDVESLDATGSALRIAGHTVVTVASAREALAEIARTPVDVLLADVAMPEMNGLELCSHVVGNRPDVPVIVITGQGKLDVAIGAIRAGAYDFLLKPVSAPALLMAVDRAVQHRTLLRQLNMLARPTAPPEFDGVIGESAAMRQVLDVVRRVAESDASLLIGGASGTGKEVIARALHRNSRRRSGPFVSVNCAALPEALLESELFGHTKGAFTDARQAHGGLFLQAQGGTFFLDEIGDMPLGLQPKLLRALQERTIRPVGSSAEIPIDVRIVAATNQDLEESVEQKRFRSDLYFRLNVVHVSLPPLRARGTDVILLAQHFLERLAARDGKPVRSLSPAAAEKLLAYDWPGNVRELQNCMDRAVALGRFDTVAPEDLPDRIRLHSSAALAAQSDDPATLLTLRELERRHVARVLAMVDGNKTTAARLLGIDRKTLYRKLEWLGVENDRH